MKNYLNYLLKNPMKLLWLLGIWLFCITVFIYIIRVPNERGITNPVLIKYLLCSFITIIFLLGNYQPYREYKDGL